MAFLKRSLTCGDARLGHAGQVHVLNGWVHRLRHHGGVSFLSLRDRYGITQVVVDEECPEEVRRLVDELKPEYCVAVEGLVRPRPEGMVNPQMATGEVELHAQRIQILSRSATLPFPIDEETPSSEATRLQHRYLDLRSFGMQRRIILRDRVVRSVREFLASEGFLEIETPTLIRSTPEGARDFLVPSRLQVGCFYALPQSPQLYKQLLMVAGFDRYYQIARCYRDEDPRGDRQPEFTQIDLEMSFVTRDDVLDITERMLRTVFQNCLGMDLAIPFPRLTYDEALERFGTDKPDLRLDLELTDLSVFAPACSFQAFREAVEQGGVVKALVLKGQADKATRKLLTAWEEIAKRAGAAGLAWTRVSTEGFDGGVGRYFQDLYPQMRDILSLNEGDVLLMAAGKRQVVCKALGAVRLQVGKDLNLRQEKGFHFVWVVDFPLFEWDEELGNWVPAHHMFSMPKQEYWETLEDNPAAVKGELYDLVCNGLELASGSIRIHDPSLQQRVFQIVGYPADRARERFGFLLDAFQYGPPPHGGIAPGLDRLLMLMAEQETIREVIAFPKNTQMASPLDGSPAPVDESQLRELGIRF